MLTVWKGLETAMPGQLAISTSLVLRARGMAIHEVPVPCHGEG